MKIAVVGSGIAGLTAGWLLNRAGHHVVLIERLPEPGLAAHGMPLAMDGASYSADIPPRMFNSALWPNLCQLYSDLGVQTELVDPSQTFGLWNHHPVFRLDNSYFSQWNAGQLWQPECRQIRHDIQRMKAAAHEDLEACERNSVDFQTYLDSKGYSAAFCELFLFPAMASTVCTCSYESLRKYPATTVLRALISLTSGDRLKRARNGSQDIVRRLAAPLEDVWYNNSLESVRIDGHQVHLNLDSGETIRVDHLVMATQANTALNLLNELTDHEQQMLESFTYEKVTVVLHQDESFMPPARNEWGTFNIMTNASRNAAMCTVWMNRFCQEWKMKSPIFQTIMPILDADPMKVICERVLQRPVVNQKSLKGLNRLAELHREKDRRLWFCGSYASGGVPLLESGVNSSLAVCQAISLLE